MAVQARADNALLHFLRRMACLLNQVLYSQHTRGLFGILNETSCVICGPSTLSSNARPVAHGECEQNTAHQRWRGVSPDQVKVYIAAESVSLIPHRVSMDFSRPGKREQGLSSDSTSV
jgi:hypothetical protein